MAKSKKTLRKKKLAMRQPTWTTGTGSKIPVFKMETSHVLNVCRFLRKAKYIIKINVPNDPPYSLPYSPSDWGRRKIGLFLLDAMIDEYERRRIDPTCIEEERGPFRTLSKEQRPKIAKDTKSFNELVEEQAARGWGKSAILIPVQKAERTLEYLSGNISKVELSTGPFLKKSRFEKEDEDDEDDWDLGTTKESREFLLKKAFGNADSSKPKGRFEAIAEVIKEEEPKQVSEAEVKLDPRFKNILVDEDKQSVRNDSYRSVDSIENGFITEMTFLVQEFDDESSLIDRGEIGRAIQSRFLRFRRSVPYTVDIEQDKDIFRNRMQYVIYKIENGERINLMFFSLKV